MRFKVVVVVVLRNGLRVASDYMLCTSMHERPGHVQQINMLTPRLVPSSTRVFALIQQERSRLLATSKSKDIAPSADASLRTNGLRL